MVMVMLDVDDDGDGIFLVERQSCKRTVAWLQQQKANGSKQALHGSDTKDLVLPVAQNFIRTIHQTNKQT